MSPDRLNERRLSKTIAKTAALLDRGTTSLPDRLGRALSDGAMLPEQPIVAARVRGARRNTESPPADLVSYCRELPSRIGLRSIAMLNPNAKSSIMYWRQFVPTFRRTPMAKTQFPAFLQDHAGVGVGNVEVPRLKLLQASSPELTKSNNAKQGEFWHSLIDERIGTTVRI